MTRRSFKFVVSDDIEKRFRLTVGKQLGYRKGVLGAALEEAMVLWLVYQRARP